MFSYPVFECLNGYPCETRARVVSMAPSQMKSILCFIKLCVLSFVVYWFVFFTEMGYTFIFLEGNFKKNDSDFHDIYTLIIATKCNVDF